MGIGHISLDCHPTESRRISTNCDAFMIWDIATHLLFNPRVFSVTKRPPRNCHPPGKSYYPAHRHSSSWCECEQRQSCECLPSSGCAKFGTILIDDTWQVCWEAQRTRSFIHALFLERLVIRERRRRRSESILRWEGVCRADGEILISGPVSSRDKEVRKHAGKHCLPRDVRKQGGLSLKMTTFSLH